MKKTLKIIYFMIILFLLKPTGIEKIFPQINTLMNIFRLISMILILILYIIKITKTKKIEINKCLTFILIIEIVSIISCIYNNQSFYNSLVFWQGILSLMLLAEIEKENFKELVEIITCVLGTYIIVNYIYILFRIDEVRITKDFILGKKNMLILYIFPFISLLILNAKKNYKNLIINIILISISMYSVIVSKSSTSIVATIIIIIYFFIKDSKLINKILSKIKAKKIFLFMIMFFVFIVIFNIQQYFSFFIVDVLHKDITFTGRTNVWGMAIDLIKENPIIGYGWNSTLDNVKGILSWEDYTSVQHAHNFILNIAYKSGIPMAVVYCLFLWKIAINIDECEDKKEKEMIKIIYIIFFILTMFEAYPTNCISLFFICYIMFNCNSKYKIKKYNNS